MLYVHYIVKYFYSIIISSSISIMFLRDFSPSVETSSSVISFCLTFSFSMNLDETVTHWGF